VETLERKALEMLAGVATYSRDERWANKAGQFLMREVPGSHWCFEWDQLFVFPWSGEWGACGCPDKERSDYERRTR